MSTTATAFDELWGSLLEIGRDGRSGGYRRLPWSEAELACRDWFRRQAGERDMTVETDRNGNLWAWWGDPEAGGAVVAGSHLDSVVDGGAYDGALGVTSGFAAHDRLRAERRVPRVPLAVVAFSDEEGARFGSACVGSRLMTGVLTPERARALRDGDGVSLERCLLDAGLDPAGLGRDDARLRRIRAFFEVHIEQGRGLVHHDAAIGVASGIWAHGRFRFELRGEGNHAGTTPLAERRDAMLDFARTVVAARQAAARRGGFATFGRVHVEPNTTNTIAALVQAWLDARAPDDATARAIVADVAAAAGAEPHTESWTGAVAFDAELRELLTGLLDAPTLATGAGHDAAVLAAAGVPAAMLFVRNRSGLSHAPGEAAEREDCLAAVDALASAIIALAC